MGSERPYRRRIVEARQNFNRCIIPQEGLPGILILEEFLFLSAETGENRKNSTEMQG
jgi:hypothetical protein